MKRAIIPIVIWMLFNIFPLSVEFGEGGCWEFSSGFNPDYKGEEKEESYYNIYPKIGFFIIEDYQLELKLDILCFGSGFSYTPNYSWNFFQFNYFFLRNNSKHFYFNVVYDNDVDGIGVGSGIKIVVDSNRLISLEIQILKTDTRATIGRLTFSKNIFK